MQKLHFYIHPHAVFKWYLFKDIQRIADQYLFEGSVLDVGCGQKPYRFLFKKTKKYMGIDLNTYSKNQVFNTQKPDTYFTKDYTKNYTLPYATNSYDHTVSFQVLEHHKKPAKMISELVRVTKPGGLILISAPFIEGLHEEQHDYYRFTKYALIDLFKTNDCKIVEVIHQGSVFSTITMIRMDALIEFAQKNTITRSLSYMIYPFFLLASYLSLILDFFARSQRIYLNYLVLAKKV